MILATATIKFGNVCNFDYWKLSDLLTLMWLVASLFINTNNSDVSEKNECFKNTQIWCLQVFFTILGPWCSPLIFFYFLEGTALSHSLVPLLPILCITRYSLEIWANIYFMKWLIYILIENSSDNREGDTYYYFKFLKQMLHIQFSTFWHSFRMCMT